MRLVIFGPPGAGKGTQAHLLQEKHQLAHISTGRLFRQAMEADTPLGRSVQSYVSDGRLVPDEVVWNLAKSALEGVGCKQFVLDGYPRTVPQAELLEEFLQARNQPLDAFISIEVPAEVIVERLSRRRMDRETGKIYHLDFNPPPAEIPPERLVQREDDQPEAIRKRINVYEKETAPVQAFYEERGMLYNVKGQGAIETVQERINDILKTAAGDP